MDNYYQLGKKITCMHCSVTVAELTKMSKSVRTENSVIVIVHSVNLSYIILFG